MDTESHQAYEEYRIFLFHLYGVVVNVSYLPNVKEHATLSAGARLDHGVEVQTTESHRNRVAGGGWMPRLVLLLGFLLVCPDPVYFSEASCRIVLPRLQ
jgi:hypothetical protein